LLDSEKKILKKNIDKLWKCVIFVLWERHILKKKNRKSLMDIRFVVSVMRCYRWISSVKILKLSRVYILIVLIVVWYQKRYKNRLIREEKKLIIQQEKEKELELLKIQKENIRLENLENKRLDKIRITEEKRLEKVRIKEEYLKSEEYQEHQKLLKDKQRLSTMRKFNRRMEEPLFKFKKLLRNNVRNSFKRGGFSKTSECRKILGADWDVVKKYFESKFTEGMSWDNMGLWHIDHILPISTATCEEDVIRLNHYTNLQPLWGEDNIKKSNYITYQGQLKEKFPYYEISVDSDNNVDIKVKPTPAFN